MHYVTSWERQAEKRTRQAVEKTKEEVLIEKKEKAKLMLLDGLPIESICKYTDLSQEEIKRLIQ